MQEIKIDGIGISPDVLTAIVSRAVSDVGASPPLASGPCHQPCLHDALVQGPGFRAGGRGRGRWRQARTHRACRGVLWLSVQETRRGCSRRCGRRHRCPQVGVEVERVVASTASFSQGVTFEP